MEYKMKILGSCPDCGSFRVGMIIPKDKSFYPRYEKDCKRFYQKHRALLRYADPRVFDESSANRFCWDCKHEWISTKKFFPVTFTDEKSYVYFLEQTEFDFQILHTETRKQRRKRERKQKRKEKIRSLFRRRDKKL